jgi:pimeloyl-ACP methyl ester carboxylesterase
VGDAARRRLLAGLGCAERRLEIAGCSTSLLESGEGPPLVLLHGGIECGGAYWAPVVAQLAARHRLVIPDIPGLGESEPMAELDAKAFTSWFDAMLRRTCAEEPTVIAHSLLGSHAARYAAADGGSIRRLVIYAAPGIGRYRMPVGLRVVAVRFAVRPTERNEERFERWAFFDLDGARSRDEGWLDAFAAYTRSRATVPHVKRTMRRLIRDCTKEIPEPELRRITTPTTLVWGRHDRFVPLELAEQVSARLGWPLTVVDDAGHVPHMEQPQGFLEAI